MIHTSPMFFVPSFNMSHFNSCILFFLPTRLFAIFFFFYFLRTVAQTQWARRSSLSTRRRCTECRLRFIRSSNPADTLGRTVLVGGRALAPRLAVQEQALVPLLGETFMVSFERHKKNISHDLSVSLSYEKQQKKKDTAGSIAPGHVLLRLFFLMTAILIFLR